MAEARWLVSPARVFARPTADQIWLGPAQQAALSQLSKGTRIRALVGPPSSGKTTLLNHVADQKKTPPPSSPICSLAQISLRGSSPKSNNEIYSRSSYNNGERSESAS